MNEFLAMFSNTFKENYEKSISLDDDILKSMEYDVWKERVVSRSKGLRSLFQSNNEIIDQLKKQLDQEISEELADEMFEVLFDLYDNAYDDLYVMGLMAEHLIPYYESKNQIEKLPFLYNVLAFESFEFYCRIGDTEKYIKEVSKMYLKVVSFENMYTKISEYRYRHPIVSAYSNLIAPVSQYDNELRKRIFEIYHNCNQLYQEHVIKVDDDERARKEYMNIIDADMLFLEGYLKELSEEQISELEGICHKLEENPEFEDLEGNLARAQITISIHKNKLTYQEAIETLINNIRTAKLPKYEEYDENTNLLCILNLYNNAENIFSIYDNFKVSKEEKIQYNRKFVSFVTKEIVRIPYTFMTQTMNNVCSEWFKAVQEYIFDFEEKKDLLFKCILCRQPITYIHSLMVSKISTLIAKNILDTNPLFFQPCFSYDVKENKDKVLEFIETAALVHDIGKCSIAEVVNKQSRRLADFEFDIIKLHPERALYMLEKDEAFQPYFDVMIGHHKTYDDQGGYPKSFHKNESPIKEIIDLISIADATDAATDIYGRNYTSGKDFDKLYTELVEFKGTRYNPIIVDSILLNSPLYNDLKRITKEGRSKIYYDAYTEILKIK